MRCIESRNRRRLQAWILGCLLLAGWSDGWSAGSDPAAESVTTPVGQGARTVRPLILPLSGPLTDPRAEVSGLTWKGDTLIVMPQDPQLFGQDDMLGFFVIPKTKILQAITEASGDPAGTGNCAPLEPSQINCLAPGLARIIRGFDGLEAMGIQDDRCYMTIEAKEDTAMAGYLVCGRYDTVSDVVHMDMTRLTAIPMGLNIPNIAEESLVIDGERIITISEANGVNCNPHPQAKVFDQTINYLGSLPFPNIEYRVTDATALDSDKRFWVMNYFFPPEKKKLMVGHDPEIERYGLPDGQDPEGCIERLLELQITDQDTIIRTDSPPIYFELQSDDVCRNWEAIVRLDDKGFLVMTDQYPGTLLAFVPNPFLDQPTESDRHDR